MKCKFKSAGNERLCEVTQGECQFIKSGYGPDCSICDAFPNWDPKPVEKEESKEG